MEKLKKCKYCCTEIDAKAKVCPNCGKKQKSKKMLVIAGIIAVIAIAGIAGGTSGKNGNDKKIGDISSSEETGKSASETVYAGIGQYVEGKNWKISLLDAKTYSSIPDDSGMFKDVPDSGKKYLVLFFEAENISEKDDYFNPLFVEAYVDGYSTNTEIIMNKPDGYATLSGDVAAGKKIKGCLTWQVDENWSEFEMTYKNGVWSDDKAASFKISSDDAGQA